MILRLGGNLDDLLEVLFQVLIILVDVLSPRLHVETQKLPSSFEAKPFKLVAIFSQYVLLDGPVVIVGEVDALIGGGLVEGDAGDTLVLDVNCEGNSDVEGMLVL